MGHGQNKLLGKKKKTPAELGVFESG